MIQMISNSRQQLQQRLAPLLRHHWQTVVGDAGLTPAELDQKRARETAPAGEASEDDDETTSSALLEAAVAAAGLDEEEVRGMAQPNEEDKEVVVKKRVFSI